MTDFRVNYYLEAEKNIREANKYEDWQAGYWANVASGLLNATMALFPDELMDEWTAEKERREDESRKVQRQIKRKLNAKK